MAEYVKKIDLLSAAVEVEYLGRPRMMVSAAKIGNIPAIEVVRCKECKWHHYDTDDECRWRIEEIPKDDDFCSYGERRE